MSNASSDASEINQVPWRNWIGVTTALSIFFGAQIIGSLLVSLYPYVRGWSQVRAQAWLNDNLTTQLSYLAVVNLLIVAGLWLFIKRYKGGFASIGIRHPKWSDPLYSLLALPVYFLLLALSLSIIKVLVPALDLNQAQNLGFNGSYNSTELIFIGISLVVLPPLVEETVFRGMIFGSLRKGSSIIVAALLTSLLFALGHLPEGEGGLLYVAAIDTFILSLILIYLRVKTNGLWAPIGLHALKNGIAFVSLFILHVR